MKYYLKNNRLINSIALIIIIYFLHTYEYMDALSFRTGLYFWEFSKNITASLDVIFLKLNTFTYLEKGILIGTIVYLLNAHRFEKTNLPKRYQDNKLPFLLISIILFVFLICFSFISTFNFTFLKDIFLFLLNLYLYINFLNYLSTFITKKYFLKKVRYLVEIITFSSLLLDILLERFLSFSLFFNTNVFSTIVLILLNILTIRIVKKNGY